MLLVTKVCAGSSIFLTFSIFTCFFFLAMYEKDGFPAEKIAYFMVRQKLLAPAIRPYRAENIFQQMEDVEMIRKEIAYLEEKEKKRKHTGSKGKETLK